MMLATIIVTSVLGALQVVSPAETDSSKKQVSLCPELHLDSGEPLNVGCFNFSEGDTAPEMPDVINATFALFRDGNASVPYRRWKFDESFQNESSTLLNSQSYLSAVIHGFMSDADADWVFNMTEALLNLTEPRQRNVITVDWRNGAKGPNYIQAAVNTFMMGRVAAELVYRLSVKYNLNPDRIHLIGHSLGGQTVGRITEWLSTQHNTKVGRATGLDVAAPGFERLNVWPNKSDSQFLEAVHTSSGNEILAGQLGLKDNFGNIDFYPNGGVAPQPGCPIPPLQIACSHIMATTFYTDFLVNCDRNCRYTGNSCASVTDAVNRNCTGPERDICKYVEFLRRNATDDEEEIVYIDTTQNLPDRCVLSTGDEESGLLRRIFEKILSYLIQSLGLSG